MGTQVIAPYRDEDEARVLKPMGDLGQIVRMVWLHSEFECSLMGGNNRNGTFEMKKQLLSACGTPIPFTIL